MAQMSDLPGHACARLTRTRAWPGLAEPGLRLFGSAMPSLPDLARPIRLA